MVKKKVNSGSLCEELFSLTLDELDNALHLVFPALHSLYKCLKVILAEVTGHNPVNMYHLVYLIDGSSHESNAHCLHKEHLHVHFLDFTDISKSCERKTAVVFIAFKDKLEESNDAYFFIQVVHLFVDVGEFGYELLMLLNGSCEFIDQSTAKCLKKVKKPLEVGAYQ